MIPGPTHCWRYRLRARSRLNARTPSLLMRTSSSSLTLRSISRTAASDRVVTLGTDALGRLLVVVYEWRDDDVRLISARKANRSERRQYERKR